MAYWKSRILIKCLSLLLCLPNLYTAENICELPNEQMFCSCDIHEPHNETELISCFVFGSVAEDDEIWEYFSQKPNIAELTFNSRTGNELQFVPTEMIQTLENLKTITFRQSKLGVLELYTFSKLASVVDIHLTNNEITELQEKCFYKMHKLNQLALGENGIRRISSNVFVDLPALQKLYLERNDIVKLEANTFQDLNNLTELDFHMNSIRKLERGAFRGLNNLVRLDLFRNKLEILKGGVFFSLSKLRELEIGENSISKVEADAFKGLDQLITLRLKNNKIKHLPSGLFTGVPLLMFADLSSNKLERVPRSTIEEMDCRFKEQFVINLEDNNLKCDCDLWWWTAEHINKSLSPDWRKQLRNIKCTLPENGEISRIQSLLASEIGCSEMTATSLTTEEIFQSPAVLLVNGMTSSESTSQQEDTQLKQHALSDESKEKHTEDASTNDPMKQNSRVAKETAEIQQNSQKENSAHCTLADILLTVVTISLSFIYRLG